MLTCSAKKKNHVYRAQCGILKNVEGYMGVNFSILEIRINGNYEANEWVKLGMPIQIHSAKVTYTEISISPFK